MSIIRCILLLAAVATGGCAVETTSTGTADYDEVADSARRAEVVRVGQGQASSASSTDEAVVLQAHPASESNGPVPDPWVGAGPVPDPWVPHLRRQPPGGDPTTPSDGSGGSSSNNK